MTKATSSRQSALRSTIGRALVATAILAGILVSTAGCGSGNGTTTDAATTAILQADTAAVTRAAANHRPAAIRTALANMSQDIATAITAGDITTVTAQRLRGDIAAINADLEASSSSTPSPSATTSPSDTESPPPGSGHDNGHGNGNGKGHGKGHGEGGEHGHGNG